MLFFQRRQLQVRVPVGRTGPDQKSGTVPSPRRDGPWSGDGTVVVTRAVPPYSLWVEGDNARISVDSRHQDHGPVSKKLLVGIAEYRVWPPWRMGKLGTSKVETPSRTGGDREGVDLRGGRPRPRSFWPDREVTVEGRTVLSDRRTERGGDSVARAAICRSHHRGAATLTGLDTHDLAVKDHLQIPQPPFVCHSVPPPFDATASSTTCVRK